MHPIYSYAFITDAEEGLILTDINTLHDHEPRNNFLKRALTWNENGILNGARHLAIAGKHVLCRRRRRRRRARHERPAASRAASRRFRSRDRAPRRCSSATCSSPTADGLHVVDITDPDSRATCRAASCRCATRTAASSRAPTPMSPTARDGIAIVDVTNPEKPLRLPDVQRRRARSTTRATWSSPRPTPRCSPMSPTARTASR